MALDLTVIPAVGLEDTFTMSLALLVDYKGYYLPDLGNDTDRPYASIIFELS